MGSYVILSRPPEIDDYLRLRRIAGLSAKTRQQAEIGLPNSWCGVSVMYDHQIIGMGRVIGDGGTAFQIVDVAVDPAHQGKGVGKTIMAALMGRLNAEAPEGGYISLIADGDAKHLYAKYGFEAVMPASIGMATKVRRP